MKLLQETTEWGDDIPNHIYCLDDKQEYMLGYIMAGTNQHKVFSKPIRFDRRGRTFVVIKQQKAK
jgi:hypothetical protein